MSNVNSDVQKLRSEISYLEATEGSDYALDDMEGEHLFAELLANEKTAELPSGTAELVDSKFGYEGGGEDIWVVFKFDSKLYRMTGYYGSWSGDEWDASTIIEVVPEEKVTIIYTPASNA